MFLLMTVTVESASWAWTALTGKASAAAITIPVARRMKEVSTDLVGFDRYIPGPALACFTKPTPVDTVMATPGD
jgi:hypothetical protein